MICYICNRELQRVTYYWVDHQIGKLTIQVPICTFCDKEGKR